MNRPHCQSCGGPLRIRSTRRTKSRYSPCYFRCVECGASVRQLVPTDSIPRRKRRTTLIADTTHFGEDSSTNSATLVDDRIESRFQELQDMFDRLYIQTETEDQRDERMREAERLRREQTAAIIAARDAAAAKAGRGKSSRELNKLIDRVEHDQRADLDALRSELSATESAIAAHELTVLHSRRAELREQIRSTHSTTSARLAQLRMFYMEALSAERPPANNIVVRGIGRLAGAITTPEGNDEN